MGFKIALVTASLVILAGIWWLLQMLGMPDRFAAGAIASWLQGQGALGPALLMLLMVLAAAEKGQPISL